MNSDERDTDRNRGDGVRKRLISILIHCKRWKHEGLTIAVKARDIVVDV